MIIIVSLLELTVKICVCVCVCVCVKESVVFASGRCDVEIMGLANVQLECTCAAYWITDCMKTQLIG